MAPKAKILIIDDEADRVENCAGILGEFGYECLTETRSDTALALISEVRPDVILTDLKMPGKDGIDIL